MADSSPAKRPCVVPTRALVLTLKDGQLELAGRVAAQSGMLKEILNGSNSEECEYGSDSEDDESPEPVVVPLPTVTMATMKTIVAFLEHHTSHPYTPVPKPLPSKIITDIVKDEFDLELVSKADDEDLKAFIDRLCTLMSSAEYLDIPPLVKLCMVPFAVRLKGVDRAQALANFGLDPNKEFTKEDEEEILTNYPWLKTEM